MERTLVQVQTIELLDAGLVELSRGDYVLTTVMLAKKDFFGNWMKWCTCGDYGLINKCMCLDKYAMPLPKEIFDTLGQAKVFNTLDLQSNYHQFPLKESDKVKMTFWGIIMRICVCGY
jgi:hypothetical protein